MTRNFIHILIAILVIAIVIIFSKRFEKIAQKYDKSPLGGTGTDIYLFGSWFAVLISVGVIIYELVKCF